MRVSDWSSVVCASDLDRLAEPQRIGLAETGLRLAPLALVGDKGDGLAAAPQPAGEVLVERGDAGTGVEQQQGEVGLGQRLFRLRAHARLEAGVEALLRPEEHTSELQSLMRNSYAVVCLQK